MSDDEGPMTVARLRALLADLPDDHLVILASDPEGNDYHQFSGDVSTDYRWDADERELIGGDDDDDEDDEPDEDEAEPDGVACIVLWP